MYRLEKAIQRLAGVEKVQVRLNPARAEVTPRGGAWIDAGHLRGAVRQAGFKPGAVAYTVRGRLTTWQGQPALRYSDSASALLLQPDPKAAGAYEKAREALPAADGKTAEVEGEATVPGGDAPTGLRVRRVQLSP